MKKIKSITEVNGLIVDGNRKEFLENVLSDILNNIDGIIKYKYYVNYKFSSHVQQLFIVLTIKKEYELIYALNNELDRIENAITTALGTLMSYNTELLLLYK